MDFGNYNHSSLRREPAFSSWIRELFCGMLVPQETEVHLGCQCLRHLTNETSLPVSTMVKEHVERTSALGSAGCSEPSGEHCGKAK